MHTGLLPGLLPRPGLIFSSELSSAALVSTSRNKGSEWLKLTPDVCPALSPHLAFSHRERKKAPPWPVQTSDSLSPEVAFPELLHRGVPLLSTACTVIKLRSDVSCAEDIWGSKILLHTKQIPCEQLSLISSAVKVDSRGWYRCVCLPRDRRSLDMIQLCSGSNRPETVARCSR